MNMEWKKKNFGKLKKYIWRKQIKKTNKNNKKKWIKIKIRIEDREEKKIIILISTITNEEISMQENKTNWIKNLKLK